MIEIVTLGDFYIKVNGEIVSSETGRTQKLWHLLSLLIANGGSPISMYTIIDTMWPEKDADEAIKALQNLIFRLRRILASNEKNNVDYVVYTQRSYMLSKSNELYIDAYEMESCWTKGKDSLLPLDERLSLLTRAVNLYNGEFFMNAYGDASVMAAVNYYKRMYIDAVLLLAEMHQNEDNIEESVRICEKAIALEPYEDSLYIRMFGGMRLMGQTARAVVMCENYFRLLYSVKGLSSSPQLNRIYQEMKGFSEPGMDAADVLHALKELTRVRKAYLCNIELFRDIYQYEVRQDARRDIPFFIVLVSVRRKDRNSARSIDTAMRFLKDSCLHALRYGDVFAQYSDYQYVIMLSHMASQDWSVIETRLTKYFYERYKKDDVIVKYDIRQALPADED